MAQVGDEVSITATLLRTICARERFVIALMSASDDGESFLEDYDGTFTAKGMFPEPEFVGRSVIMVGVWKYDQNRKDFYLAINYTMPTIPNTVSEVTDYLIKCVHGIGKKTAAELISVYGADLASAVEDVDCLTASLKTMTATKARSLKEAVMKVNATVELTKILQGTVDGSVIKRIASKYGEKAMDTVRFHPYKMFSDGMSFKEADAVARQVGFEKDCESRVMAGIEAAFRELRVCNNAIVSEKDNLLAKASKILDLSVSACQDGFNVLLDKKITYQAGKYAYLVKDLKTEVDLANAICGCVRHEFSKCDVSSYEIAFRQWQSKHPDITLATKQAEAVLAVASNRISVVTGGPGTGKTTVLKAIIDSYQSVFPKSEITLMAPTGLAAKRMTESCDREAKTVHSALGLRPAEDGDRDFVVGDECHIEGGLVIIDEFSMVGIHLAEYIFEALNVYEDTRIVFVGDVDQLPPVSPGSVLADLIKSERVKVTKLNRNFRQEAGSNIIDAAYKINDGDTNISFVGNFLIDEIEGTSNDDKARKTLERLKVAFADSIAEFGLSQTYILSPMRKIEVDNATKEILPKYILSTTALNPILRDIANPPAPDKKEFRRGLKVYRQYDRVVNLKNSEESEIINGDIGYVVDIINDTVPTLVVRFDGKDVGFTPDTLGNLDWAYAITVHKSQGCEFDSVIIPASMHQKPLLQRNMLYTAVTRAKKRVLIIGDKEAVYTSVKTKNAATLRDLLGARIRNIIDKERQVEGNANS